MGFLYNQNQDREQPPKRRRKLLKRGKTARARNRNGARKRRLELLLQFEIGTVYIFPEFWDRELSDLANGRPMMDEYQLEEQNNVNEC